MRFHGTTSDVPAPTLTLAGRLKRLLAVQKVRHTKTEGEREDGADVQPSAS